MISDIFWWKSCMAIMYIKIYWPWWKRSTGQFNCWFDFPEGTGLQIMLWRYRTYISNIKQFILTKKDLLLWNQNCIGWECFCKNAANYIYTSKYCTACHAICVKGLRHMKFAINSCCLDILPMKVSHLLKHHADICYEWKNRTKYPIIYKYMWYTIIRIQIEKYGPR